MATFNREELAVLPNVQNINNQQYNKLKTQIKHFELLCFFSFWSYFNI